jgi:colanic acid/amylovoran biosynthesis glycosyltransferase
MKIAYVIARFPVLSETFVASEIERLCARGIDVRIYSFARPREQDLGKLSPAVRALQDRTTYITHGAAIASLLARPVDALRGIAVGQRISRAASIKSNSILMLLRAVALAKLMRAEGIGHLHAHWPYASQLAHIVRKITGVSYSISVHAHEVAHDNGHFPVIFPALSFATFCNRGALEYLLPRIHHTERDRAHLVYHGVDLERFKPLPLIAANGPIHVVSAGRLTRTKGFDRLIRACASACEQGLDVRLTVLGQGPIAEELRALAAQLSYGDRLTMPGWVSHEQVRDHMRSAHLFALLADTTYHDGLPNVVLEAMASARPVVLSPLPSANEVVTAGVEGFVLSNADDIAGFVKVVSELSKRPDTIMRMGAAARHRVERDHDANVQIERMVELMARHVNPGARISSSAQ